MFASLFCNESLLYTTNNEKSRQVFLSNGSSHHFSRLVILGVPMAQIIYPAYSNQGKDGKLLIALFSLLIGVLLKVISWVCVQRLYWKCIYPGYSYVLLTPLYFCSAVMFRILQADLGSLQSIAVLGRNNSRRCRSHRTKYYGCRWSHLPCDLQKNISSLGKFS